MICYNAKTIELKIQENCMAAPSGTELLLIFGIGLYFIIPIIFMIPAIKYLPAKYSRKQFWIWSVILMIANIPIMVLSNAPIGNINEANPLTLIFLVLVAFLPSVLWVRALANRIRDYGSNPYIALWAVIPLVNIILALYYGTVQYKKKEDTIQNNQDTAKPSLVKAVKNHAQDIAEDAKENLEEYKEEHQTRKNQTTETTPTSEHVESTTVKENIDEDTLYEQAMNEIENDTKVKSLWAKAFANSDGNEEKAKALYIQYRVDDFKRKDEEKQTNIKDGKLREQALKSFLEKKNLKLVDRISDTKVKASDNTIYYEILEYTNNQWHIVDKILYP